MRAAEHYAVELHAMANDPAITRCTLRCQCLNGAFERIEEMALVVHDDLEGFVVTIPAGLTGL